jgi:CubicO group peptidase (beta-lactamase class C family)
MAEAKRWVQTGVVLAMVASGLGVTAVVGLFTYITITTRPLHPDIRQVPSIAAASPPARWAGAVEEGRQIVLGALTDQNLPGISVAVGVAGDLAWAEGFGWADLGKHIRVAPATRFRIAEVSNTLTSAAVGLLLETKKLNLDEEIQTYVPEFPNKQWPITLRQLMGHVAGVRTDAGDEEPLLERCARTVDGIQRFKASALRFEPGTQFRPSSYGWILVSAAVEAAAGEPFFTYMRRQIFEPLGMAATRPDVWKEPIADRATFYYPRFAGNTRYGPESVREGDQSCFAGAGAFLSTPSDLVRFGLALESEELLKPATVALLQTPQRLASDDETEYGLGWNLQTVDLAGSPARMAGHGSKTDFIGGTAYLLTLPERRIVVAVTSNISFADTRSVALTIAQAFAKAASL